MRGRFNWQEVGEKMTPTGYSDSDWAGDRRTGKSTSGGVVLLGEHLVKAWSRTQYAITLSSAEAELVALGKLAMEPIANTPPCALPAQGGARSDQHL